jgi:hypothetical protein
MQAGPLKPVSVDLLRKCWILYADNIHEERPRMSVALKATEPFTGEAGIVKYFV